MRQSQLNKLLQLVNRTGDKIAITNNNTDSVLMLMNLDSYETLLNANQSVKGLSEEEMMNKINRDIALWRSQNQAADLDFIDKKESLNFNSNTNTNTNTNVIDNLQPGYWDDSEENKEFYDDMPLYPQDEGQKLSDTTIQEEQPLYFEHESVDGFAASSEQNLPDFGEINIEESLDDIPDESEELEFHPEPILETI